MFAPIACRRYRSSISKSYSNCRRPWSATHARTTRNEQNGNAQGQTDRLSVLVAAEQLRD